MSDTNERGVDPQMAEVLDTIGARIEGMQFFYDHARRCAAGPQADAMLLRQDLRLIAGEAEEAGRVIDGALGEE